MKSRNLLLLTLLVTVSLAGSRTFAISPFKKAFDEKYVKESGDEAFQTAFRKAGCYTCHVRDEEKEVVNAYGWELAQLIEGNAKDRIDAAKEKGSDAKKAEEEKLVRELAVAMKKVEASKAPSGETFGELLKAHSLPTAEGAKSIR